MASYKRGRAKCRVSPSLKARVILGSNFVIAARKLSCSERHFHCPTEICAEQRADGFCFVFRSLSLRLRALWGWVQLAFPKPLWSARSCHFWDADLPESPKVAVEHKQG